MVQNNNEALILEMDESAIIVRKRITTKNANIFKTTLGIVVIMVIATIALWNNNLVTANEDIAIGHNTPSQPSRTLLGKNIDNARRWASKNKKIVSNFKGGKKSTSFTSPDQQLVVDPNRIPQQGMQQEIPDADTGPELNDTPVTQDPTEESGKPGELSESTSSNPPQSAESSMESVPVQEPEPQEHAALPKSAPTKKAARQVAEGDAVWAHVNPKLGRAIIYPLQVQKDINAAYRNDEVSFKVEVQGYPVTTITFNDDAGAQADGIFGKEVRILRGRGVESDVVREPTDDPVIQKAMDATASSSPASSSEPELHESTGELPPTAEQPKPTTVWKYLNGVGYWVALSSVDQLAMNKAYPTRESIGIRIGIGSMRTIVRVTFFPKAEEHEVTQGKRKQLVDGKYVTSAGEERYVKKF